MDKCLENWIMFRQFRSMKPIFLRTLWQRARLVRGPVGLPLLSSNMAGCRRIPEHEMEG